MCTGGQQLVGVSTAGVLAPSVGHRPHVSCAWLWLCWLPLLACDSARLLACCCMCWPVLACESVQVCPANISCLCVSSVHRYAAWVVDLSCKLMLGACSALDCVGCRLGQAHGDHLRVGHPSFSLLSAMCCAMCELCTQQIGPEVLQASNLWFFGRGFLLHACGMMLLPITTARWGCRKAWVQQEIGCA
jgi:hypothetical protein